MGLAKVTFNFVVKNGGKLAKSLLCSKPQKCIKNINGLKYVKPSETDKIKNLYHITTRANWLKMQLSKSNPAILPSFDGCFGKTSGLKGVFTVAKDNLINHWHYSDSWRGHLGFNLLSHTAKKKNNLVCIKIPIENLNKKDIIVRSQNNLFSFINHKGGNMQEAFNGLPLSEAGKIPKGSAVEYIYKGEVIPLENVEVIGRANAKEIAKRLPQKATHSMWFDETIKDLFGK